MNLLLDKFTWRTLAILTPNRHFSLSSRNFYFHWNKQRQKLAYWKIISLKCYKDSKISSSHVKLNGAHQLVKRNCKDQQEIFYYLFKRHANNFLKEIKRLYREGEWMEIFCYFDSEWPANSKAYKMKFASKQLTRGEIRWYLSIERMRPFVRMGKECAWILIGKIFNGIQWRLEIIELCKEIAVGRSTKDQKFESTRNLGHAIFWPLPLFYGSEYVETLHFKNFTSIPKRDVIEEQALLSQ